MRNAMKMKEEKKRWLHFYNRILSGGLVLLGFSACDSMGDAPCEYGQPHCDFGIKGKVQDELQQAVNGARIIVKELDNNDKPIVYHYPDTLYTQVDGKYDFLDKGVTNYGKYRVICEDPSGIYKADSTDVKMKPTGGKGWYEGSDTKEVDFVLKKKNE